jgi:hypothetical protein
MGSSQSTTDHGAIRKWVESRNGHPAVVKATTGGRGQGGATMGILRIDFEPAEESLSEVSWDDFFATFDENQLMFVYQETTADGAPSRFCKFVRRDAAAGNARPQRGSRTSSSGHRAQRQAGPRAATASEEQAAEEADEDDAWDAEEEQDAASDGGERAAVDEDEDDQAARGRQT